MQTLFLQVGMSFSMKVFSHSVNSPKRNPHLHYKVFCPLLTLTYPLLSNIHSINLLLLLITMHLKNHHQTNFLLLFATIHLNLHQTNILLLLVIMHLKSKPTFFSHAKKSSTHYQPFSNRPFCLTIQSHINPTFLSSRLCNEILSQSFEHCPRPAEWNQVSYASFSF